MCVCGGDGEEVCLRLRGREEERGLSKEDESENQVCTWRRCKDASSWNKVTRVQGRQCSTLCTAAKKKEKVASQGPSPSAILLTGMTTVPRRTIILDRQADIKCAGSCPCQDGERKASQKVESCPERGGRDKAKGTRARYIRCSPPCFVKTGLFRVYVSLERCFSNERIRHTDVNLVFSSRGRRSAYVYANLYFDGEEGEKRWAVMGAQLWSEIKQTAPLQRTSSHLCDVKSKLINKGSPLSRRPVTNSGCRGFSLSSAEESHMSKLSLSYRATSIVLTPPVLV